MSLNSSWDYIAPPSKLYTSLQAHSAQSCTYLYTPSPQSLAPCLKLTGRRYTYSALFGIRAATVRKRNSLSRDLPNFRSLTVAARIFGVFLTLLISSTYAATHNPQQFLESIRGSKNEGSQIVQQFCASCHAVKPLIELGAPKIDQVNDWKSRVTQSLDTLFKHVEEGYGAMPARGGCFECTDLQLRLAILALLPKSMQKELSK